jgi:hypothetical protein
MADNLGPIARAAKRLDRALASCVTAVVSRVTAAAAAAGILSPSRWRSLENPHERNYFIE